MIQPQLAVEPGGIYFLTGGYNDEDAIEGLPLLGADGHTLSRGLRASGLGLSDDLPDSFMRGRRREVARLVWERRTHSLSVIDNNGVVDGGLGGLCGDARTREACLKAGALPPELEGLTALGKMGYAIDPMWLEISARVRREILQVRPNIVVCLGDLPLWLLTGQTSTDEWRGAVRLIGPPYALITRGASDGEREFLECLKLLPTFHPNRIHQEYRRMVPFLSDLMEVKREAAFPEIRQLEIAVWLDPDLEDLRRFEYHYERATIITVDIETARGQITSIQFGVDSTTAITVPFVDYRQPSRSYWQTLEEELTALDWCEKMLASPTPKLMQNGTYDTTYLMDRYDLEVRAYRHDLRLVQHILSPEEPKSLSYIGSMHTQMNAWKAGENKGHGHVVEVKRDD